MNNTNFALVTFVDKNDAICIIASNWIKPDGNICYYPNVGTDKGKLLRTMAPPDDKLWPQHKIKIHKKFGTYKEAWLHLTKAEDTSNLDSNDEQGLVAGTFEVS